MRPSNNYSPREILGLRLMYADRLDEARELLEASLDAATELGDELDRMSLRVHLTQLECRAGNLARAREHAHEADLVEEQLGGWARPAGAFVVALAAAHVGRVDEARAAAERGASLASRDGRLPRPEPLGARLPRAVARQRRGGRARCCATCPTGSSRWAT